MNHLQYVHRNWRKSARFRKGEALQFSNVTRGRSNTQALPQDITQLKPKILLTRVNVTVLYPRQKLIIGEPLVAEVTLVDSITSKFLLVVCSIFLFSNVCSCLFDFSIYRYFISSQIKS